MGATDLLCQILQNRNRDHNGIGSRASVTAPRGEGSRRSRARREKTGNFRT